MARMKKLAISVMNIKIHPHSPQLYIDLFECLKSNNNKMIGKIRGNDYAIIGWMHSFDSTNPTLGLYGEFYKYLNIDPSQPWLDISKVEN